jgi:transposase
VASASPHEVTLAEETIAGGFAGKDPDRLIADRAYDSDPLDQRLKESGIILIAPHKANRKKPATQDGRSLRKYRKRWRIERFFAWLQNYRKVVTRYEYKLQNFAAFVKLACIMILFKHYF